MIVLFTKDLFFVPLVKSAAQKQHQQVTVVTKAEDERLIKFDPREVIATIVDLSAISADALPEIFQKLSEVAPKAVHCAFGSHVHTGRLELASQAGFSPVLTRGQLNQRLANMIEEWVQAQS